MLSKSQAIDKLQGKILEIEDIRKLPNHSPEFIKWRRDTAKRWYVLSMILKAESTIPAG